MTTRDFVPLTQYTELKNDFLKLNDRRNKLEIENTKLKTENKWYSEQLNEAVKKIDKLKEQQKIKADCKTLAKKLLQVKPELKEWLEVNYKEYL